MRGHSFSLPVGSLVVWWWWWWWWSTSKCDYTLRADPASVFTRPALIMVSCNPQIIHPYHPLCYVLSNPLTSREEKVLQTNAPMLIEAQSQPSPHVRVNFAAPYYLVRALRRYHCHLRYPPAYVVSSRTIHPACISSVYIQTAHPFLLILSLFENRKVPARIPGR